MTKLSIFAMLLAVSTSALADKDKDKEKEKEKDDEADFAGSYTYTGTYTVSLTSPTPITFTDTDDGHLTITPSKKGGFVLTFTASGETCQISATRSGKTTIKPSTGQTCSHVDKNSSADYTLTLTSGSGSLAGDSLSLQLAWKLSGSVSGVAVTGKATEVVQAESK